MRPSYTFWFWFWLALAGILMLYPRFCFNEKAQINPNRFDKFAGIHFMESVLGQYQVDNGFYPKSLQDLVQKPDEAKYWCGPYVDGSKMLVDYYGNKFIYECPGKHNPNAYDLFSAGPDGRIGTDDDIGNWQN